VNVKQSTHVYGSELRELKRTDATMEVRLDVVVSSVESVAALGIAVGDFVSFEPRTVITESGFVKSRFLDNKASVAIILAVTEAVLRHQLPVARDSHFIVTNYEEVGHGAAAVVPPDTADLLAIDMAAIGDGQNSTEFDVTLCVKDSGGPYDHQLGLELRQIATRQNIPLRTDIYPYYASDATAAWRAGADVRAALIGPGIDASHAYERTHRDALMRTAELVLAWLQAK
jgi:putative aminopeptidase FrvX